MVSNSYNVVCIYLEGMVQLNRIYDYGHSSLRETWLATCLEY